MTTNVLPLAVSGGLEKTGFRLTTKFNIMQETNNLPQNPPLQQTAVGRSVSFRTNDKEEPIMIGVIVRDSGKVYQIKYGVKDFDFVYRFHDEVDFI